MQEKQIVTTILKHFPDTQAIYLFGSYGTEYERHDSDVDIAVLLPVLTARSADNLVFNKCGSDLESLLNGHVDLINLRLANTVFQHEIVQKGQILFNANKSVVDFFEMITMSLYQKLNDERKAIIQHIINTKKVFDV